MQVSYAEVHRWRSRRALHLVTGSAICITSQVTKYVEREILNHRFLMHPHIVQFKEVRAQHHTCVGKRCFW